MKGLNDRFSTVLSKLNIETLLPTVQDTNNILNTQLISTILFGEIRGNPVQFSANYQSLIYNFIMNPGNCIIYTVFLVI
jgi:hypothetical protein